MAIVGFFDILGTREAVMADRFSDVDALEFVNPIGIAARFTPNVRFAVFSDSLIVSADDSESLALLRAINFMYGNWFSELVYVRGALAIGDIHWIHDSASDDLFQKLSNFTYARVYGKGLVLAHQLEQKSGPGAVCYLTENVAEFLRRVEPCAVLESHTPMLCWATEWEATGLEGYAAVHLEGTPKDTDEWRHAFSTRHYWANVVLQRKYLPVRYSVAGQ